MKKNRPGFELILLIQGSQLEDFSALLFKETSTIGFRYQQVDRKVMQRRFEQIDTEFGPVTVKINQYGSTTKKHLNTKTVSVLLRRCSCRFKKFITNYKNTFINLGDIN